jgi:TolB-like protein
MKADDMSEAGPINVSAAPAEVVSQMERILASRSLAGSDQLQRLLRLVVERALSGQSHLLKEYNLGLEVFRRPPDYDPKVDPIVRVQARRLRARLAEYYAVEGTDDPVLIEIPKGAYVPAVTHRNATVLPDPKQAPANRMPQRLWIAAAGIAAVCLILAIGRMRQNSATDSADIQRSVAVLPLSMFTEGRSRGYLADQVAEVLTTELARNKQLRVLSRTTASRYRDSRVSLPEIAQSLRVRWVVEGGVGVQGNRVYVKLRSVDSQTDRKIWADAFDCDVHDLVAVNARAADRIAAAIGAELRNSRH